MLAKDKKTKPYSDKDSESYEKDFTTKDPSGMVADIEKKTKRAIRGQSDWAKAAKDDYKFALGKQWTQEELDKLNTEGRPALVYNKIEPLLDLVSGYQRENSVRIRVNPEGGEDRLFAEVADRIIKAIDKWTKLNYKLDHVFDDGQTCGKGNLEMFITYDDDPIRGDLGFRLLSPYQLLWDPDSTEYDKSDAKFAVKLSKQTKGDLIDLYPKKKDVIEGFAVDVTDYYGLDGGDVLKEGDRDNYHLGREEDYSSITRRSTSSCSFGPKRIALKDLINRKRRTRRPKRLGSRQRKSSMFRWSAIRNLRIAALLAYSKRPRRPRYGPSLRSRS
jgi:hypothetical protein